MSKYSVKLLPKANRDLDEIYRYIKDEIKLIETAKQMIDLLQEAILGLDEMPYRGAIRKTGTFSNKGYRQIFLKNFTIIYRIDEDNRMVIVATVRYTPSNF
ncbi:type II toxin-antitoxin system RelE/ParE family toxin [Petrocella sp. FN5]|uniref:type II toxin-antitoxin system RelE/ParE family toxin n=1 Tax=Petrocella sp. FN5 TaxID=3032002 RepID=UPI0023DC7A1F|nr:type II toxin-antitoxin system RelE/ParE family toxin [Petrocella sp. FN5]MDF1618317.1 type II toxin-antitoxin system RelE/ParE family toxin [Petrocella sp. FN5]